MSNGVVYKYFLLQGTFLYDLFFILFYVYVAYMYVHVMHTEATRGCQIPMDGC